MTAFQAVGEGAIPSYRTIDSVIINMKRLYPFLFLIILVVVASCGKVTPSSIDSYVTMSSQELKSFLTNSVSQFPDAVRLKDVEYVLPTEAWINKRLTPTLGKFLFDYNVRRFQDERNDCDDFAIYCRAMASVLQRHNSSGKYKSIAVGEVDILTGFDGHAMNFIVVAGPDKKPKLIFYEPQVQQVVNMESNFIVMSFEM